ncbi:hypothetical protein [Bradyrhizobium liaoningense]|uniref:hypothetical protein n=1 Tax=Bradyrhizobium liaoningense TaxID=43992 RepID=UPI001BAC31C0|nr:hypothetical protein [Bradyrhizobium liaoningense]MBR1171208.1 hypothetical protein [Bradyrhizobium liaoningense]
MALTTGATRVIVTDNGPFAESIEWKTHATILLNDVALIEQNMHSSGPHILLAHAIELMLKGYIKAADALKPRRKAHKENYGHHISGLLAEAKSKGLTLSDADTEEYVDRLGKAIKDAQLRYSFPFYDLPTPMEGLRVARALMNDISVLVKPETPEEIQKRRADETAKKAQEAKRVVKLPGT